MRVEIQNRMGFVLVTSAKGETPAAVLDHGAHSILDRDAWEHTLACNPLLSIHVDAGEIVVRDLDEPAADDEATKPSRRKR